MTSVTLFVRFRGVGCDVSEREFRGDRISDKNELAAGTNPATMTEGEMNTGHYEDMQSAPRFPLHLAASVKSQGSAFLAETENISANGVLFAMDNDVPVGSMVDFTIMLPAAVLGGRQDMQIDCRGRVVRSFEDRGRRGVGVVIDEYHFERA